MPEKGFAIAAHGADFDCVPRKKNQTRSLYNAARGSVKLCKRAPTVIAISSCQKFEFWTWILLSYTTLTLEALWQELKLDQTIM